MVAVEAQSNRIKKKRIERMCQGRAGHIVVVQESRDRFDFFDRSNGSSTTDPRTGSTRIESIYSSTVHRGETDQRISFNQKNRKDVTRVLLTSCPVQQTLMLVKKEKKVMASGMSLCS